MEGLLQEMLRIPEIAELKKNIDAGDCRALVTGPGPVHRTMTAAALAHATGRPLVMLCSDEREVRRAASDLSSLLETEVVELPPRELQFHAIDAASRDWEYRRLGALCRIASGQVRAVVTTAPALAQRCIPPQVLREAVLHLECGQQWDLDELLRRLTAAGYVSAPAVEGPGQFARRGGILDIFSPGAEHGVRCEFFDDELDSMGTFSTDTQRRIENIREAAFLPAGEFLPFWREGAAEALAERMEKTAGRLRKAGSEELKETLRSDAELLRRGITPPGTDRYGAAVYETRATALDYFAPDTLLAVGEGGRISEDLRAWHSQLSLDLSAAASAGHLSGDLAEPAISQDELTECLTAFVSVQMESLPTSRYLLLPTSLLQMQLIQLSGYGGSLDAAILDLTHYLTDGDRVLVLCASRARARNLSQMLEERKISAALDFEGSTLPQRGQVLISLGSLSFGSEFPSLRLAVLTEGQLLSSSVRHKKVRPVSKKDPARQQLQSYTDLTPGDLVVHVHHGIGRFVGMIRMPVDGVEKDYIKIAYAGRDTLYVPATSLDLVSKYIGGGENQEHTKLSKLGGTEWKKTTHRARAAAQDLAKGLIALYAQRQRQPGFAFSPDSPWQQEFEDSFEYEETSDQLQAVAEIKADMERPVPMDRLLCGDVGYGKTEVALRAVMKCILDGKQAAILVPTTVLAQQHYTTAVSRFRNYPVTIEVLSRFRTPKQVKDVLERVREGRVDLLIGTHKLLGRQVQFKDLGLLVIDEEQRFGVKHKEDLRKKARQVDTLTLSATPIPRTLNMALSGIRDMSALTEPPHNRQSVQTYVLEHDWTVLIDAIRRELNRGGQVYYLHNRVENIESTVGRLRQMLGEEVSIGVAHGQMTEAQLKRVMQQMADGEIDILVCTTIIETGIDIANVNTLIIEDADRMGLAQLHQIRGRIGRSARRAYAYLTYKRDKVLSEVAAKRLTAIREFVDFGSGFKIAMRDLEIRGAGNLLGPEQSGFLMSVGYDLYLKLLNDAVLEQQGRAREIRPECSADLTVSANIPEWYVASANQRMDLYRRIASIRTPEDSSELLDEMIDRFGDPPAQAVALLDVALLRAAAAQCFITDITQKGRTLSFTFNPEHVDLASLTAVISAPNWNSRIRLRTSSTLILLLYLRAEEKPLEAAGLLVEDLQLKQKELGPREEEDSCTPNHRAPGEEAGAPNRKDQT